MQLLRVFHFGMEFHHQQSPRLHCQLSKVMMMILKMMINDDNKMMMRWHPAPDCTPVRPRPRHPPYGWLVPAPPVSRPDLATSGLRPAAARGPEAGCGEAGARRVPRPADHWLIRTSRHNRGHPGHGENPRHLSRNWNFSSNIPEK